MEHTMQVLASFPDTVRSVAFSPDGQLLAAGCADSQVRVWDVENHREQHTLRGHSGEVNSVVFSPSGELLLSGSDDGTIRIWHSASGSQQSALELGHGSIIMSLALSTDGANILVANMGLNAIMNGSGLSLWDRSTGKGRVLADSAGIVTFATTGMGASASLDDSTIRLWDLARQRTTSLQCPAEVNALAFSPDGKLLACGLQNGLIVVWNIAQATYERFQGHQDTVFSVAFSADGKWLASGSHDQTIRLWDAAQRNSTVLNGHTGPIYSVTFSCHGLLASSSQDGSIRLWHLSNTVNLAQRERECQEREQRERQAREEAQREHELQAQRERELQAQREQEQQAQRQLQAKQQQREREHAPAAHLQQAMALARSNPHNPETWVALGKALLSVNPPEVGHAKDSFERALKLAPSHAAAQQGLAALTNTDESPTLIQQDSVPPKTTEITPAVVQTAAPQAPATERSCPTCGCPILAGTNFCMACGAGQGSSAAQRSTRTEATIPLATPPIPTTVENSANLVRQGIVAFQAGRRTDARALFAEAAKIEPNSQLAWLWLAGCSDNANERHRHLERVVAIDPRSAEGQRASADLAALADTALNLPPPMTVVASPQAPDLLTQTAKTKDPNTAMVIEIIAGFFGFLGMGHIYGGFASRGIASLVMWWIVAPVSIFLGINILSGLGAGALCMIPLVWLGGPIISGFEIKHRLEGKKR